MDIRQCHALVFFVFRSNSMDYRHFPWYSCSFRVSTLCETAQLEFCCVLPHKNKHRRPNTPYSNAYNDYPNASNDFLRPQNMERKINLKNLREKLLAQSMSRFNYPEAIDTFFFSCFHSTGKVNKHWRHPLDNKLFKIPLNR